MRGERGGGYEGCGGKGEMTVWTDSTQKDVFLSVNMHFHAHVNTHTDTHKYRYVCVCLFVNVFEKN